MATNLKSETSRLNKEVWLETLDQRIMALFIYVGSVMGVCLVLSFFSPQVGAFLFWTFVQGESSYLLWHYFYGLHPLKGYLPIVLTTGTIHLAMIWFIVFRGKGPLLDLPIAKRLFNPARYSRLQARMNKKRNRATIFSVGIIPTIWWVGFLHLRKHPMRMGVATVLLGNVVKLTTFSVVFWLGVSVGWAFFAVAMVALAAFFSPRLVERFFPNNNQR
ncbi:MAG: hypothetical protein KJI72_01845 [Patescibacteria group bacterium]|nr:hypothetical protein [Patescibacteria group bacterium]